MATDSLGLRIAEALAARLCHELVSPVGAVTNGVELLAEDTNFMQDALALIGQSAGQLARRLQFYRLAYGSLGEIPFDAAATAATEFFADTKSRFRWSGIPDTADPGLVKAVLNGLLLVSSFAPRGGDMIVSFDPTHDAIGITVDGKGVKLPDNIMALLRPVPEEADISPRNVQALFTAMLARRLGYTIDARLPAPERAQLLLRPV